MSKEQIEYYKMNHKSRGFAVIINNFEFQNTEYKPLHGHKKDVENYEKTFKLIGFKKDEIKIYVNQTAYEIKQIMNEFAHKDYTECDCFIGVFLSHGYLLNNTQFIMGIDQGVMFHEHLTDVFRQTESLNEKPKIFFMDVCRGDEDEPYYSKSAELNINNNNKSKTWSEEETESSNMIDSVLLDVITPKNNNTFFTNLDFFFGWPSVYRYRAKITANGSLFSTVLCETIENNFHHLDLLQIDLKVRNELKKKLNIVTSQSENTMRKLCFFGSKTDDLSHKRQRIEEDCNFLTADKYKSSIIMDYYKPLIEYRKGDAYTNTLLNEPLWFNRQQELNDKRFEIELNRLIKENNNLAKYISLSLNKTCYSQLSNEEQNELKRLSSLNNHCATSLLITFLIRDNDLGLRNIAIELLKNGESNLDSVKLKIFAGKKANLEKLPFIDLTHSKLTGLDFNGIDFSGHNLNGLIAEQSSIENVKFNHCSLESSNFKSSKLTSCYFNQCNLFKSNLSSLKPIISCHLNDCFLADANLSSSTFEKCVFNFSDFDQTNLRNCSFYHCCFEDVYNLNMDQFSNKSISFENECSIDVSLFHSCQDYFEKMKINKGIKLIEKQENNNKEHPIQLEIKINTYYNAENWSKTIQNIDLNSDISIKHLLMRGNCYFKLNKLENYIKDIYKVIEMNSQILAEHEYEIFMRTYLTSILNDYGHYKNKEYFKFLAIKVIELLNINSNLEDEIFRMLIIIDQDNLLNELLPKEILNTVKINELGLRNSISLNEKKWQTKIKSMVTSQKTQVEMSWINDEINSIETGYLLKEYVDYLFDSKGSPKIDKREKNGKKLVILLKSNNERLVYLKFYPDYPLRQRAVDELCKRLSGFSSLNILVKLKHTLNSKMIHPVLISEPLGIENRATLYDCQNDILQVEQNLDPFLYTWKFIETYLIQPRDDKGDNLSVNNIVLDESYSLISIDSDLTFGYKFNRKLKEPNAYSLIYFKTQGGLVYDRP